MNDPLQALIDQMTLEEKVGLIVHESKGVERLGIPAYNWWSEALHGVARNGAATVFPQAIGLAATFDVALAQKEYEVIATEARAKFNESQKVGDHSIYHGVSFWSPNINIARDPRWGRAQETFGEDPCLTAAIGVAAVKGLQGDDPEHMKIAACAKHFAVHSGPEISRHTDNMKPSMKDLWETYLPAFKALVDAGVETVMGAYSRLLDEPCCGSEFLLQQILRKKWGFKGHVVSDCWAVRDFHETHHVTTRPAESTTLAISKSCDLNCGCTFPAAVEAVQTGLLEEKKVDEAVYRLLTSQKKLGLLDPPEASPWAHLGKNDVGTPEHRALARKVAQDSIVLLKNKNNLLPLTRDKNIRRVQLTGPASTSVLGLLGNYFGINKHLSTIMEGVAEALIDRPEISLEYNPGTYTECHARNGFGWAVGATKSNDVNIVCLGLDFTIEGEEGESIGSDCNGDRNYIEMPPQQLELLRQMKAQSEGKPIVLVILGGQPIAFPDDLADAILYAWYPGEAGGNAIADIIFGTASPSAHLPVTFPKATTDLPGYADYSMANRGYRYAIPEPLFPFGFGLTYTQWQFQNAQVTATDKDAFKVTLDLANIGEVEGAEVVQLYVSRKHRTHSEARCHLRRFSKHTVAAGEKTTVSFELSREDFLTINDAGEAVLIPDDYIITLADAAPLPRSLALGATQPVELTVALS